MSPRLPIPARAPSRLRSRPRVCALSRPPSLPAHAVDCAAPSVLVARGLRGAALPLVLPDPAWSEALAHPAPQPLAALLAPLSPWDAGATDRAAVAAELAAWPLPAPLASPPLVRYPGRPNVTPPPLRQRDVAGDLGAALAGLADAPVWVDPRLAAVREAERVCERGSRGEVLAALARLREACGWR